MQAINEFTAVRSFGIGFVLAAVNPKNLMLTVAAAATLPAGLSTGASFGFLLLCSRARRRWVLAAGPDPSTSSASASEDPRLLGGELLVAEDALLLQLGQLLQFGDASVACGCRGWSRLRSRGLLGGNRIRRCLLHRRLLLLLLPGGRVGLLLVFRLLMLAHTADNRSSRAGDHCGPSHRADEAGPADSANSTSHSHLILLIRSALQPTPA